MILIIGGAYQGKGALALKLAEGKRERILFNIHERIGEELRAGRSKEEIEAALFGEVFGREGMILTADEIGCGIIPMDVALREYREITGRILCELAQRAEKVYRVTAGISQKIKG